jgi:NAD(P)-dependent dehydrogenase (short-subunit alcohol dehydrogenase family)
VRSAAPSRIALVTGATGGIGGAIVRGLVGAVGEIVIGCRDVARGEAVAAAAAGGSATRVRVRPLDLASLASVSEFVRWADGELSRLDLLICNAAVWPRQRRATRDGFELAFGVNHLAHHALTVGLLPVLGAAGAARVVIVSSGLHARGKLAWDDLMQVNGGFNGTRAYEQSKLANVVFALALARRAGPTVTANAVHPGIVRTGLTREYPELLRTMPARAIVTPGVAAKSVLRLALDPALAGVTGRYFDRDRAQPPARAALERAAQDRLWQVSDQLIAQAAAC